MDSDFLEAMRGQRLMNYQDVALNKPTFQSSTYSAMYPSSNGVTGDTRTFFHTQKEIDRIELVNRVDCCGERLRNLHVSVSSALDEGFEDIYIFKGPGMNGESFIIKCNDVNNVRFVKLTLNTTEYLHMATVRVYAYDNDQF